MGGYGLKLQWLALVSPIFLTKIKFDMFIICHRYYQFDFF